MNSLLDKCTTVLNILSSEEGTAKKTIKSSIANIRQLTEKLEYYDYARTLGQDTLRRIQDSVENYISSLVTEAVTIVFPEDYKFWICFVPRRGLTEGEFSFSVDGVELTNPLDSDGGGAADVVGFSLRVSYRGLLPGNRPILFLDEPFRNLTEEYSGAVSEVLKVLCDEEGLQIIFVTQDEEAAEQADNVIYISKKDGKSVVST